MWVKSEADRKLYNLELAHTVEVLRKGSKFYVVALYSGVGVNAPVHVGDLHVAQLTLGRNEEDAHQMMSRITRSMGEDVLNLDTAEARRKASVGTPGGSSASGASASSGTSASAAPQQEEPEPSPPSEDENER